MSACAEEIKILYNSILYNVIRNGTKVSVGTSGDGHHTRPNVAARTLSPAAWLTTFLFAGPTGAREMRSAALMLPDVVGAAPSGLTLVRRFSGLFII